MEGESHFCPTINYSGEEGLTKNADSSSSDLELNFIMTLLTTVSPFVVHCLRSWANLIKKVKIRFLTEKRKYK
jgi:hypothetical protein